MARRTSGRCGESAILIRLILAKPKWIDQLRCCEALRIAASPRPNRFSTAKLVTGGAGDASNRENGVRDTIQECLCTVIRSAALFAVQREAAAG
jgi:hypothetical protein